MKRQSQELTKKTAITNLSWGYEGDYEFSKSESIRSDLFNDNVNIKIIDGYGHDVSVRLPLDKAKKFFIEGAGATEAQPPNIILEVKGGVATLKGLPPNWYYTLIDYDNNKEERHEPPTIK